MKMLKDYDSGRTGEVEWPAQLFTALCTKGFLVF